MRILPITLLSILALGSIPAHAESTSSLSSRKAAIRDLFVSKSTQSCESSLNKNDAVKSTGLQGNVAKEYCSCTSTKLFDSMDEDELKALFQTSQPNSSTKEKTEKFSAECLQTMIQRK